MSVPVMDVRIVRMPMHEHVVHVGMRMRFGSVPRKIVTVPMMFVMVVRMIVRERLVLVHMFVALGEVQIDA